MTPNDSDESMSSPSSRFPVPSAKSLSLIAEKRQQEEADGDDDSDDWLGEEEEDLFE